MASMRAHFSASLMLCIGVLVSLDPSDVFAQGPDWTEKDLAKSVHRAEQTFRAGEMSRAYGLFAHLVSVANDRAFLHLRFGATCTYTSQRLDEAHEHLNYALQLGILETEHANDWHFYMGRLKQLNFEFDEARLHFTQALENAPRKSIWLNNARTALDQCADQSIVPNSFKKLEIIESLVSHSNDFFRLYDMPIEHGRLLSIPDELQSNEDHRRGYESFMHWLPGSRMAFFSSYGKDGSAGLDIYRVAVNGKGEYGAPIKLPEPINTDFDDCSPILFEHDEKGAQYLFFSSSRPESMGGFDIFESQGLFTANDILISQEHALRQLPFEINSTSDEWLYWPNIQDETTWLTTNRNQDFETKEIWHFQGSGYLPKPVSIRVEVHADLGDGVLTFAPKYGLQHSIQTKIKSGQFVDIALESGEELEVHWKGESSESSGLFRLAAPEVVVPQIAMESAVIGLASNGEVGLISAPSIWVDQPDLSWSLRGLSHSENQDPWFELLQPDQIATLRGRNLESASIDKVLMASRDKNFDSHILNSQVPEWILNAMAEIGINFDQKPAPQPIARVRSNAVHIQNQMEVLSCWEAPGSDDWNAQTALKRYGEPALALLSEETRELAQSIETNLSTWNDWSIKIDLQFDSTNEQSEDWEVLTAYVQAQIQAFEGASIQIEEMHRRIESHLVYERWVTDALPMQLSEFNSGLSMLSQKNPQIADLLASSARSSARNESPEKDWLKLQESIWNALTDSIIDVQTLGVYTLPGMEQVQEWFLRSGGLLEEATQSTNPKEKISKGQRAVGLIWESYIAGTEKRDLVIQESKMNPGEWWRTFGTENLDLQSEYEGLTMFTSSKAPLLDQANRYQSELDKLRLEARNGSYNDATLTNAISIRSGIAEEMNHLFGKNEETAVLKTNQKKSNRNSAPADLITKTDPKSAPIKPVVISTDVSAGPKTLVANSVNEAESETISSRIKDHLTIQLGAFFNEPDFDSSIERSRIHTEQLPSGLTRYYYGEYTSRSDATSDLVQLTTWLPDAFVKSYSAKQIDDVPAEKTKNFTNSSSVSKANEVSPASASKPATIKKSTGERSQKEFRVKIATFGAALEPVEVARLLRLGNELALEVRRTPQQTTYYSQSFSSIEQAQDALHLCERKGFTLAELEIVY